jgi:hypothetical protein
MRAYLSFPFTLIPVVGADAYAKFPVNEYGLKFRLGAGAFTDFLSVGFRGVVGLEVPLGENVFLTYEWRPIVLPSLWSGSPNPVDDTVIRVARALLLLSVTIALEYRF